MGWNKSLDNESKCILINWMTCLGKGKSRMLSRGVDLLHICSLRLGNSAWWEPMWM
jgi:hypothetical protein